MAGPACGLIPTSGHAVGMASPTPEREREHSLTWRLVAQKAPAVF